VAAIEGPVLGIAGAGSGKTRVIEFRVRHLVESGVDPGSILLLPFTRRAAQEMISRLSRFIDAANVRACLDQQHAFPAVCGQVPSIDQTPGYGKTDLLAKLLGSLK
jgi:superfamily I DNA/RNA helicase